MRRQQSKSVVFLTEILLALTIFALCSSVCAGLFALSYRISEQSGDLSHAVIAAQSGAEAFKLYSKPEEVARVLGGAVSGGLCIVYYNADWRVTAQEDAVYTMRIAFIADAGLRRAAITLSGGAGADIYNLDVAALLTEDSL